MSEWKSVIDAARTAASRPVEFRKLARRARQLLRAGGRPENVKDVRVAMLGRSTLDMLAPSLELSLFCRGLLSELFIAPYGSFMQELLDPESATSAFKPQFATEIGRAHV